MLALIGGIFMSANAQENSNIKSNADSNTSILNSTEDDYTTLTIEKYLFLIVKNKIKTVSNKDNSIFVNDEKINNNIVVCSVIGK